MCVTYGGAQQSKEVNDMMGQDVTPVSSGKADGHVASSLGCSKKAYTRIHFDSDVKY